MLAALTGLDRTDPTKKNAGQMLTVRSSYGAQLMDGTYYFRGDYMQEIQPSASTVVRATPAADRRSV